jgi:peptide/nickel transport system permease protein
LRITFIVKRVAGGVLVLWLLSLVAFSITQLLPGDAANSIAGEFATKEQVAVIRHRLGLDKPFLTQYWDWFTGILHGNFGSSLHTGQSVTTLLTQSAPATLSLTGLAVLISIVFSIPTGVVAALRQGKWTDRVLSLFATVGIAMPNFWVSMLLILIFAQLNHLLPATSYVPLSEGFPAWISHLVLPATALGIAGAATLTRHTRGCVIDVLSKPYIRAARARGASGFWLIRQHVLRNSMIPVITVLGLQVAYLLGGAIVVESVAGISGLGTLVVQAILGRDYPTVQGFVLFAGAIVVVVNLIVDLTYGWLNPKVRAE